MHLIFNLSTLGLSLFSSLFAAGINPHKRFAEGRGTLRAGMFWHKLKPCPKGPLATCATRAAFLVREAAVSTFQDELFHKVLVDA